MKLVSWPTDIAPASTRIDAEEHEPDVDHRRHDIEQRFERPTERHRLHAGGAQVSGQRGQPFGLALLGAVRLDELHGVEALVHAGRQIAEVCLRRVVEALDALLVHDVQPDQDREHGDGDGAEHEIRPQQPDGRDEDQQHRAGGERHGRQY